MPNPPPSPIISLIAAMSENRVIGQNNRLPWRMPADMAFFKTTTTNHPIIAGRKNFESFHKPLPNRRNIIITRNPDYSHPGIEIAHSIQQALQLASNPATTPPNIDPSEIFITGGSQIYSLALPLAHRIYLTIIHTTIPPSPTDILFPDFDLSQWHITSQSHHNPDPHNPHPYTFIQYDRK